MERSKIHYRRLPVMKAEAKRDPTDDVTRPLNNVRDGIRGGKPGNPWRTTLVLKEAILYAAKVYGRDGKGKDGLVGYLLRIAERYPKEYTALLARVLPLTINAKAEIDITHRYRTPEEVKADLAARGIVVSSLFD